MFGFGMLRTSHQVSGRPVSGQVRAQRHWWQSHPKLSAELHQQPSAALRGRSPLGTIPRDAQSVDLVARKHLVSTRSFGTRTRVAPATIIMLLCASPKVRHKHARCLYPSVRTSIPPFFRQCVRRPSLRPSIRQPSVTPAVRPSLPRSLTPSRSACAVLAYSDR